MSASRTLKLSDPLRPFRCLSCVLGMGIRPTGRHPLTTLSFPLAAPLPILVTCRHSRPALRQRMPVRTTASPVHRSRHEGKWLAHGVTCVRLRKGGCPVTDNGMKGRVKGLLAGTAGADHIEHTEIPVAAAFSSDPNTQRQALQVLTLAQRTPAETEI